MEKEKLIDLVTKAKQGDGEAVESLFSEFYNDVYYFAHKTVKDPDLACDITQESFLEVINTLDQLQEPAAFHSWLRKITYHQCTRYFKKKKEVQVDEDEDGNSIFDTLADESEGSVPSEVYEKEEFRKTILDMVDNLSEEQRAAVMLYYFDELSVEEVANIQGVSVGTVKSRLNYARKALKKSVEDYEKKNGIKLHSLAPLPLLLLLLRAGKKEMPKEAAAAAKSAVCAAAGGTAAATGAAAGGAAGIFGTLGAKIAAGIVVAAIAATGVTLAVTGGGEKEEKVPNDTIGATQATTEQTEEKVPMVGEIQLSYKDSENLEVFGKTDTISGLAGARVLGASPQYLVTKDGICYALDVLDEPEILHQKQEGIFSLLGNNLCFRDASGTFYDLTGNETVGYQGTRGSERYIVRTFSDKIHLIGIDDAGAWASTFIKDTGERLEANQPMVVKCGETILEHSEIRDIRCIAGIMDETCVITDEGFLYGSGQMFRQEEGYMCLIMDGSEFIRGKILDFEYYAPSNMPLYIDENGQLIYREQTVVPMPEGYTTADLKEARTGSLVVLVFNDGSIYCWNKGAETPVLQQELTSYNQKRMIKGLYMNFLRNGIIVQMQDGVFYTVKNTET